MIRFKKKFFKKLTWIMIIIVAIVYLNNTNLFIKPPTGKPTLLAHRGLAQTFSFEGITNETNTAQRINPPEHPYLENTISSMQAAFKAGADIVELDIQATKDGQLAVFHDWTLEYRTNGKGTTQDYTMAELKKLDVGYGYTADGGKTFPFRGKGIGIMPSLDEVLTAFPNNSLLINIKSNKITESKLLLKYLNKLPKKRLEQLAVYGDEIPINYLKEKLPSLRVMSKKTLVKAMLSYMAIGWTGYVPEASKNTELHIPLKYAPILWGWPYKFLNRMNAANTKVIIVAGSGKFSEGFDTPEDLKKIPKNYTGGIWTNRIDKIAPIYKNK